MVQRVRRGDHLRLRMLQLLCLAAHLGACVAVKTAVLVHGYHLEAPNWEEVVWGGGAGRIAHGARVAEAFGAELLMVGSGASTHGDTGETEGAYTLRWLRERRGAVSGAPTLVESATASLRAALGLDPPSGSLEALLDGAVVDARSRNTREELERAAAVCRERAVDRVFLVSSPAHCPRVARDAAVVFERDCPGCAYFVAPCGTDFCAPGDVAVLEPPHRPDQAQPGRLHAVAARALRLPPAKRRAFETFADNFLADLEMRDEDVDASLAAPLGPPPADAGDLAAQAKAFFAADDDT